MTAHDVPHDEHPLFRLLRVLRLQCVCLSTLTRLREVNLSHNCLDDLSTSGLAASDDLRALNLSHNRLSLSSLSYFSLLPALEQLFLVGNTAMAAPNARHATFTSPRLLDLIVLLHQPVLLSLEPGILLP